MTRFIITLEYGVKFVLESFKDSIGGEIFIPKLPSVKIVDIVEAMIGKNNYEIVGIRPGEKLHEIMIPKEEARNCIELKSKYIIEPAFSWWNKKEAKSLYTKHAKAVRENFEYSSDKNTDWLSIKKYKKSFGALLMKFPYARPVISNEDLKLVNLVLKEQYLSGGRFIKKFEEDIKKNLTANTQWFVTPELQRCI